MSDNSSSPAGAGFHGNPSSEGQPSLILVDDATRDFGARSTAGGVRVQFDQLANAQVIIRLIVDGEVVTDAMNPQIDPVDREDPLSKVVLRYGRTPDPLTGAARESVTTEPLDMIRTRHFEVVWRHGDEVQK